MIEKFNENRYLFDYSYVEWFHNCRHLIIICIFDFEEIPFLYLTIIMNEEMNKLSHPAVKFKRIYSSKRSSFAICHMSIHLRKLKMKLSLCRK
uniref:Uncharacterized protein n=1 Tax=Schistosoma mansoni TaxID=6183 RepID=A0A5K4F6P9_SCHMA